MYVSINISDRTSIELSITATYPCSQPVVVGTDAASLPRWYYGSLTQQCLQFTYSSIGGNQNNFLSRNDCERSCPGMYICS